MIAGRRLRYHTRDEWQIPSRPVAGPAAQPSFVHHLLGHWPGASDGWVPPRDVASHLRWAHDLYLRDRGYSYGYGFVIGPNPINWNADPVLLDVWEVRGLDIRVASNNGDFPPYDTFEDPPWNGRTNSIQVMCSTDHPSTFDQRMQFRYMAAHLDVVYRETLRVEPHDFSDYTLCPGVLKPYMNELRQLPPTYRQPPAIISETGDDIEMWIVAKRGTRTGAFLATPRPRGGQHHVSTSLPRDYPFIASGGAAFDLGTGKLVSDWGDVTPVSPSDIEDIMGAPV